MSRQSSPLMDEVLSWFRDPRPNGTGMMVRCPAHEDDRQSLHISLGRDGRILLKCHAGCETETILERVGKSARDLFPPRSNTRPIETTYDYVDEAGDLLYQSVRKQFSDRKTFYQRRPDGRGGWINKLDDIRRVPYRLPDLIAAVQDDHIVVIVEGEKDADRLASAKRAATTNAGGAGKWSPTFAPYFSGAAVVLIPDNDQPGYEHMLKVYQSLADSAETIVIVQLLGLPEKADFSDYADRVGDQAAVQAIDNISSGQDLGPGLKRISVEDLADLAREQRQTTFGNDAGGVNDVAWPDLKPLPPVAVAPNLDPAMIPEAFRAWLSDIADLSCTPVEMIAAPAMVASGAVVGRSVGIRPWEFNDYVTVPNIWGAVVARPGWMKSSAVGEGLRPVMRLAAEAHEDFETRKDAAAAELAAIDAVLKDLKRRMEDAAKRDGSLDELKERYAAKERERREAKVTERRYVTHDATVEKLGELLKENPRGMLVARDELFGLLRSFEKSGRENDRQFYLEAWDGTGSFTTDRIGRGTIHIPALTVSIIGSIQPGRVRALTDEAATGGGGDDGLLQRFQVTVWPDQLAQWKQPTRWPDSGARTRAFDVFRAIDHAKASDWHADRDRDGAIPFLTFSPPAQSVANLWRRELEDRLRSTTYERAPSFVSHLAKYRSLMPSLALLFHLIDVADNRIDSGPVLEASVRLAAAWCEFLEVHARKLYDVELDRGRAAARALAVKIEAGALIDGDTVRDIYRRHWAGLQTDELVIDGLIVLAEVNWIRLESVSTGGRSSQIVRLHPALQNEVIA